jgi:hypothetical protein
MPYENPGYIYYKCAIITGVTSKHLKKSLREDSRMRAFVCGMVLVFSMLNGLTAHADGVYLNANAPVQLSAVEAFGSDSVAIGQRIAFETIVPLRSRGVTFIPEQAPASATVVSNKNNGFNGEPARLILDQFKVESSTGKDIRLRCRQDLRGERRRVPNVTAGGGVRVGGPFGVFLSVPVLSMFVKGEDVNIPAGTEFTCYTLTELEAPALN